jgi:2-dehydro-3-deoxy-L-rhamnonate dehydrogenase (NAD+)
MPNHYEFGGRVALVTGGASGIGAATVALLRTGGADVHVFDMANGEDVRDSRQLNDAVERLPRLDVLVCAAGVGGESLHTEEVTDEEWERVHAINLNGVFYANRAAIPKMKENGYGRIVNIASIAGKEGNPMAGAYSSSKAAVIGLTKAVGKDVAGSGILVNCIAPAVINTPILGQLSEEHIGYMTARIPLGRMGEPHEVAALICWLASEEMTFSTAACFDISGGRATYWRASSGRRRPRGRARAGSTPAAWSCSTTTTPWPPCAAKVAWSRPDRSRGWTSWRRSRRRRSGARA